MLKMEDELKIQHEKRNESKYIRNYERNGRTVCTNGRRVCTVRHRRKKKKVTERSLRIFFPENFFSREIFFSREREDTILAFSYDRNNIWFWLE